LLFVAEYRFKIDKTKSMKILLSFIPLAMLLLLADFAIAQRNARAEGKIDSTFASYTPKTPGVAVAIVKEGKMIFAKGYGMANLEHDIPVTPQTVFNIASVSKQFTAFAIYLLESEGKISFEDDIRKYFPELPQYPKPIKIKHLMGHTSGLMDTGALLSIAGGYVNGDINTTEQNLKLLSLQRDLNMETGSAFGYSNTNYFLLAEIIHRVSGITFSDFTNQRIFAPLGMKNTWFCDDYERVVKNRAESYELGQGWYHHKSLIESNPGPSNLLTTAEDLCKWVLNFESPSVGSPKILEAFNRPSILDNGKKVIFRIADGDTIFYAKGQNVSKFKGSYLGHGGHTAGFRTFLGRFPEHRLAIIQLSNDEDNERLGGRWDIADYYLQDEKEDKKQVSVPLTQPPVKVPAENYKVSLDAFAGNYFNSVLDCRYHLEATGSGLILKHRRLYDISLKRTGDDRFSGYGSHTFAFEIVFIRNGAGEITGFDISNWGAKNVRFAK
jgi:CubicO group peptidase (beta-lactamase class C family)